MHAGEMAGPQWRSYIDQMPLPAELLKQMATDRRESELAAGKDRRRALVQTSLACLGWMALGLALIGWSMHTTNTRYAAVAFWTGLVLGNGGIIHALLAAYRQGERRGDW